MPLKSCTLLFVEDDLQIQELLKTIFEEDVETLYQAYNGQEGLTLYREKSPDIIVTDISMPLLDGIAMSQEIKRVDRNQPILIMSAFDEREILLDAINFGIDGFIVKPVEIGELNQKLHQIAHTLYHRREVERAREQIVEQKRKEAESLYQLAHYDTLTNIPNRYLFNEKLEATLAKAGEENDTFSLFFIDLDDFKTINDTYGHKAGDQVLISLVNRIKEVIGREDILARIGGDEFALIVKHAPRRHDRERLAKEIIERVSLPLHIADVTLGLSCSIGIGSYPEDTTSKEELLHFADLAMYRSKSTGKSSFAFYEDV